MSGSSKEKKGQCRDWPDAVCRALEIGFVWLESSQVFIYTSECFKWQLALFPYVRLCASACARLNAYMSCLVTYVHASCAERVCVREIKGDGREQVSETVPSARRPLEFPHGWLSSLSSSSIIDHIHSHQPLELITTPVWLSEEKSAFVFSTSLQGVI